jgi:hypothetical protein
MTRRRIPRDPKPACRQKRAVRGFDDDESDETIISLGFVDPKVTTGAGAPSQSTTAD